MCKFHSLTKKNERRWKSVWSGAMKTQIDLFIYISISTLIYIKGDFNNKWHEKFKIMICLTSFYILKLFKQGLRWRRHLFPCLTY